MKTIEYHNPDFADGVVFGLAGLAIPNGGKVTLDHDAELAFFAKHQMNVTDVFKDDRFVKVTGDSELTAGERKAHTGVDVNSGPVNLDAEVMEGVEPQVDSQGNVVEEPHSTLGVIEAKEDKE